MFVSETCLSQIVYKLFGTDHCK